MIRGSTTLTCLVNLVTILAYRPFTNPILTPPEIKIQNLIQSDPEIG